MWCEDKKLNVVMAYQGGNGSFGIIGTASWDRSKRLRVLDWYTCREDFFYDTYPLMMDTRTDKADRRRFLFSVRKPDDRLRVASFLDRFEDRLSLSPRSTFGPTGRDIVMWCRPSLWWVRSHARRSLFTALLRAGLGYSPKKDNFERALNYRSYTKRTRKAIDRFLSGHTTFRGNTFYGWQATFQDRSDEEIQRMLIKSGDV